MTDGGTDSGGAGAGGMIDAVVLRLQDYRESDRLVWLLTRERGRLSAVARGARKSRKRFGGHLDLFQQVRVRATRGKGSLHTLQECRVVTAWPRLRHDVERYALASFVSELAIALSREEAEDAPLYDEVAGALALFDDPATPVTSSAVAALLVKVLTTSGFVMDLSETPPGRDLSEADAAALARWQRAPLAEAVRTEAGPEAVAAARALLHDVVGKALKSEAFLWGLLGAGS